MSLHFGWSLTILGSLGAVSRVGKNGGEIGKFSRTGERAPGVLLLLNQFHDSFEFLSLIGHKNNRRPAILSRCFRGLLIRWS